MNKLPIDELVQSLETQTTRRTIVKTGAKLAYAAPLVAATFKLTGGHAAAQILSAGTQTCRNPIPCGQLCGANCGCVPNTEGSSLCHEGRFCPGAAECVTTADCPGGTQCVATCCNTLICAAPCGSPDASSDTGNGRSVR